MDIPADRSTRTAGPPAPTATRPAGRVAPPAHWEPPPPPHHLQTSGFRWLVATVVLLILAIVVFGRGLRGLAVDLAASTPPWSAGWPGSTCPASGEDARLAALSSWWVLNSVASGCSSSCWCCAASGI